MMGLFIWFKVVQYNLKANVLFTPQVHVSNTENPEEASFFESYEAAHSSHSLSGSIAKVVCPP